RAGGHHARTVVPPDQAGRLRQHVPGRPPGRGSEADPGPHAPEGAVAGMSGGTAPTAAAARGYPAPDDRWAEEGAASIQARSRVVPRIAVVLGSGLGSAIGEEALSADQGFELRSLPGFPPPSVPGHAGRLVLGSLFVVPAAVLSGRVHYYEGRGMHGPTLVPRLAAALGARTLILTNAAGGLDRSMRPGELMLIRDHINHIGANPLLGWRFADGTPA